MFASQANLSCRLLGVEYRACKFFEGNGVPRSLFLSLAIIAAILALGLYDPRPLFYRLEQCRRPAWWLALNAAGAVIFVSPYLLVAAGVPAPDITPLTSSLMVLGAALAGSGLLLWLSGVRELAGSLRRHQVLVLIATVLVPFVTDEIEAIAWSASALQAATVQTTAFFLEAMGQRVASQPADAIVGIGDFQVIIDHQCSGIAGVALVSAVMGGYVLALREQLWIGRALLLLPAAAALSWLLNGVRIAALLMIGANVSPGLAMNGFHEYAGWITFCVLSALMLFAAENVAWIHREGRTGQPALPVLSDPVAAQIGPFIVLLLSSLLTSAFFTEPEAGYPLRFALMAVALLAFQKAYRPRIAPIGGLPVLAGAGVAIFWLGAVQGHRALTVADILGPVGSGAAVLWVSVRVAGTVLLVPLIEEMFFRGYLLRRLDFGGLQGKAAAVLLSSAAFGALHTNVWLAAASGVVFGLVAIHKGRVFDAVAAHAIANAGIAAWAVWTGDWSVIQ
ncbi:MAG: exosortase E/protease, VPEID-CTERM system [Rhodomicrobium sp.]